MGQMDEVGAGGPSRRTLETVHEAGQGQACLDGWVAGKQKRAQGPRGWVEIKRGKETSCGDKLQPRAPHSQAPGPQCQIPGKVRGSGSRPAAGNWC